MKILYTSVLLVFFVSAVFSQTSEISLIRQDDNIIRESTVIKIHNLGDNINSDLPELRPTISPDGNLLFFICQNHPANNKYNAIPNSQDIWYAKKDSLGNWQEARRMRAPLNTAHYNAVYWISPSNNRMLIRGAYDRGAFLGKGISMTQLNDDSTWSVPHMLYIKNYEKYDRGNQSGATMAHDGKTLLLYLTPKRNSSLSEIYVSFLEAGGIWSEPKSLGKKINLVGYDNMAPYMAADGVTMYFSSDRPGGFGQNDIWMATRLDDSWMKWSDPVNLGEPINTPDWDAFFTLDAGGEYAYMSTFLDTYGESDIVKVQLMEKEKPKPVVLLSGNVYDAKTKKPISANLIYETLPDGEEAGNSLSNPKDGAFKMVLPYDKNYLIRATANKYFAQSENLNLDSLIQEGYMEIHKDLYLFPIEIGQVVRLNNVFFDFDKASLRDESFVELDRLVVMLKENSKIEIELSAHTDSKGSDEYNFRLSDNRARSVKEYLVSKGIAESRMISQGYGESKPVATNETDEGRQLNRRVEFTILKN